MGDHGLHRKVMSGEVENAQTYGSGGGRELMDGLRCRGSSAIWHHGGLEHSRT